MILAVDIGNSSVGFGFFEGEKLTGLFRAETRVGRTSDEYAGFLVSNMDKRGFSPSKVEGTVLSSVVPPLVPVFFEMLKNIGISLPLLVSPRLKLGIRITYKTPETLGTDRIVCASAAYMQYAGPVVVIDFGTATTFTAVDHDGNLMGGAIAPGVMTGSEALTTTAAGLPRVPLTFPKSAIGVTTNESLQSGIVFGHAAMVEGMLARMRRELGGSAVTVATGGAASLVGSHIKGIDHHDPELCFKGLAAIYRKNK